ncbi:hypothetical protein HOF56_03595 [Candidatus Peribacteria bacterium]|jgi:hypothetical protein|nr:hypothetical protein [Candidatus Peribacteria bacterium]MBT4021006.1 hypothetical protein [Candidatus Peribacteria bacterium]MBT4240905.1 hypothetical protein [Candidatus Peribacteria bacterium]MBT4474128.1 hypothetical protein [Candidatus Peribacteria bacterium]
MEREQIMVQVAEGQHLDEKNASAIATWLVGIRQQGFEVLNIQGAEGKNLRSETRTEDAAIVKQVLLYQPAFYLTVTHEDAEKIRELRVALIKAINPAQLEEEKNQKLLKEDDVTNFGPEYDEVVEQAKKDARNGGLFNPPREKRYQYSKEYHQFDEQTHCMDPADAGVAESIRVYKLAWFAEMKRLGRIPKETKTYDDFMADVRKKSEEEEKAKRKKAEERARKKSIDEGGISRRYRTERRHREIDDLYGN